jgi:predicted metal-dependent HD superfamily phosphohydrolase
MNAKSFNPTPQLRASLDRCWIGIAADQVTSELFRALIDAYAQSHRKYHTLQHLSECLALFSEYRELASEPDEVEIALWFHDAIYDVKASDNEAKSAQWAAAALRERGVDESRIERVQNHILATRHAALPQGADQVLLVDIDLSILGATADRFDEYEQQVRAEYRWVPDFLFKRKRREILAEFLARSPIYGTAVIRDRLEGRARENLARSLTQLAL